MCDSSTRLCTESLKVRFIYLLRLNLRKQKKATTELKLGAVKSDQLFRAVPFMLI